MKKLFSVPADLTGRNFGLDLMRSLAILLVVFGHSLYFFQNWFDTRILGYEVYTGAVLSTFVEGFDGVDLFFVLSGFLIGSILLKTFEREKKFNFHSLTHFWKRRWLRTIPLYFLILTVNVILFYVVFEKENADLFTITKYYVFCQNLVQGGISFFPESWSLSVEEWFYLSLPLLILATYLLLKKNVSKKKLFLFICLFYLFAITAIRLITGWNCTGSWNTCIRTVVVTRLDTILFGVLAAWCKYYYVKKWLSLRNYLFVSGLFIVLANFYLGFIQANLFDKEFYLHTFYFSFVGLGIMLLLPKFDSIRTGNRFFLKFITLTSLVSYSMYLVNYSILLELFKRLDQPAAIGAAIGLFILFWLAVYLVSILLFKYVEQPVLRYRDRLYRP